MIPRSKRFASATNPWVRFVCVFVCIGHASPGLAQGVNLIPVRKSVTPSAQGNPVLPWSLHLKDRVTVSSPLLRLRDVVNPIDSDPVWWDRAGASIIGLMPVDKHVMAIPRTRLIDAMSRSTITPEIMWSGANEVQVTFERRADDAAPLVTQVSVQSLAPTPSSKTVAPAQWMVAPTATDVDPSLPTIPPSERDRIVRLIHIGIDRYDSQMRATYDIEIDRDQSGIDKLRDFRRIDLVTWQSSPTEGTNIIKVDGMNGREPVSTVVEVSLVSRALVVVAKESFRRGYVLTESDLALMPAQRNVSIADVLTDPSDAIGMQVQSVLQKDRPISRSSIGAIVVIQRGDLIEVRVLGGGISIATSATALAPGAKGELIAVETTQPRRKLMARVADAGIVEIVTRPPRVQ